MSYGDEMGPELCRVPLSVAPTKDERKAWCRAAEEAELDLHTWMVLALNEAAGAPLLPRLAQERLRKRTERAR